MYEMTGLNLQQQSRSLIRDRNLRRRERTRVSSSDDFLNGSGASGRASEADVGGIAANGGRNIDGSRGFECFDWIGSVRNYQSESSAVISKVSVQDIATVEIHTTTKSDRRHGGRSPIEIHTGGIVPFPGIVVKVELDRNAFADR